MVLTREGGAALQCAGGAQKCMPAVYFGVTALVFCLPAWLHTVVGREGLAYEAAKSSKALDIDLAVMPRYNTGQGTLRVWAA